MNPDFQTSPSRLSKIFKRPSIYITIFVSCLLPAIVLSILVLIVHFSERGFQYAIPSYSVCMTLSVTLLTAFYIRGYLRIRRHVAGNPIYANDRGPNSNESPVYLKELFKTVLILLITISTAWIPVLILNILKTFAIIGKSSFFSKNAYFFFEKIASLFFYSSATSNAFIIFYRNKKSRDWLIKCFTSHRRQQREETQNSPVVIRNIVAEEI